MDALHWRMPTERLRVPAVEFAAVLNAVAARWHGDRGDRFAAGALACGQWIAGMTDAHPLRDEWVPCTVEAMQSCHWDAESVVAGKPWREPGIDERWALGVATMLAWARGAPRRLPIDRAAARSRRRLRLGPPPRR
jgi:hypothetical protein